MKKIIIFTGLICVLALSNEANAFMPPTTPQNCGRARVSVGLNYGNTIHTSSAQQPHSNAVIRHAPPGAVIVTPPPPPPIRHTYTYRDFGGQRRFPRRSYYIPPYCMPETGFNIETYNPFCSHYKPYGSNMYISF